MDALKKIHVSSVSMTCSYLNVLFCRIYFLAIDESFLDKTACIYLVLILMIFKNFVFLKLNAFFIDSVSQI